MRTWLAIAAVAVLVPTAAANAQMTALVTQDVASVAKSRSIDLRLTETAGIPRSAPLVRGLIVSQDLAPNAVVGVGFSNLYERRRGGDFRGSDRARRSNKPAVTFVVKF